MSSISLHCGSQLRENEFLFFNVIQCLYKCMCIVVYSFECKDVGVPYDSEVLQLHQCHFQQCDINLRFISYVIHLGVPIDVVD